MTGPLRLLGSLLLMTGITALLLEISLRVVIGLGAFRAPDRSTDPAFFYRDSNPSFGIWHTPHAEYGARDRCYDVRYQSNSWGARDRERALDSDEPRVVVLGDSFIEGIGVDAEDRMTDVLERRTGVPHLNFGTAGDFSSVQEFLLYRDLASRFDHDLVLIFTLPNNDFLENDPEKWWQPDRYRPYLRREGGDFEVYYPIDFEESQRRLDRQLWWNHLYNALYIYRFVAWLDTRIRVRMALGDLSSRWGYVGYDAPGEVDLERLFWSYRQLRDAAAGREVVVFTIPRYNDLVYRREQGVDYELPRRLAAFAEAEPGIAYVDLLPGFDQDAVRNGRDYADYYHSCDGHWSPLGNAVAADLILRALSDRAVYRLPGGAGVEEGGPGGGGSPPVGPESEASSARSQRP